MRDPHIGNLNVIFSNYTNVIRNKCRSQFQTFPVFGIIYEKIKWEHPDGKSKKYLEVRLLCKE